MPSYFPAVQQSVGSTRTLLAEPDGSRVVRTVLPTGLRVISESIPGARSVSVGVWVGVGSRDETTRTAGTAHFLEHLLFKGTGSRTALEISAAMDAVGGELNAFTTKELTCFYAKALPKDLALSVDILLDITTDPKLAPVDIDAERTVVLEEIAMHEDDAGDRATELLQMNLFDRSRLGRPILGNRESIATLSPRTVRSFFTSHYRPQDLVVAVAGDVDHRELVDLVASATEPRQWPWGTPPNPIRSAGSRSPRSRGGKVTSHWPGEQCTVVIGAMGLPRGHPDRRVLDVLNEAVGGGMSSRLFQSIREDKGLAYAVSSFHIPFSDAGVWALAAGCSSETVSGVIELAEAELAAVRTQGLRDDELLRAKGRLSGNLVLSSEETLTRMGDLGRAEVVSGELPGISEALDRIERVTAEDVARVAERLLSQPRQQVVVGPDAAMAAAGGLTEPGTPG